MAGANGQSDSQSVDTDIFVIVENEKDYCDFVTVDEDTSYDAVVIDISQEDLTNAIRVDFDAADDAQDSFVSIDEDQVFASDFTADDLLFDF